MKITLKDGVVKEFDNAVSVLEIAKSISEGLARNACAGIVDGEVKDLRFVVDKDAEVSICTFEDEAGKMAFRHTASHILAQAVKRLYPEAKIAIGPAIADGFYYDFDREKAFTQEELEGGMDAADALEAFLRFVGKDTLVGHNLQFDLEFLRMACIRNMKPVLANRKIDLLPLARRKILGLSSYKLLALAQHFALADKVEHRAVPDCRLTQKVYAKLNENGAERNGNSR